MLAIITAETLTNSKYTSCVRMAKPFQHFFFLFTFQVGKAEFLGRAIGKPNVLLCEEDYKAPSLEWFQIYRGTDEAGELLAAFEMFEVDNGNVHLKTARV